MKYACLEKKVGETPRMAVEAWRTLHPEYTDTALSYAGRLDPMASGKLLVLIGDECKKQSSYTNLDKEYQIEVLLDIGTDTGDALGFPTLTPTQTTADAHVLKKILAKEIGAHTREYPAFSSKTVAGKPLFMYALEGTLDTIAIPTHTETLHRIAILDAVRLSGGALRSRIETTLADVPRSDEPSKTLGADFRQDAIRNAWEALFKAMPERTFSLYTLQVICGSGTYMRTLAPRIGAHLGTQAIALSIHRSTIGTWQSFPVGFWRKKL